MKILDFLQDNTGHFSSTRLFKLLVAFSAIIDWQHAIWTVGIWTPKIEVLTFTAAVLGISIWQKNIESKK